MTTEATETVSESNGCCGSSYELQNVWQSETSRHACSIPVNTTANTNPCGTQVDDKYLCASICSAESLAKRYCLDE